MHGEQTMNTRGALLHVLGDLLGSVAALVSGAVVMWTGWMTADPLLSLLICALMLASSLRLLREVLQALMEGVPPSLSTEQVGARAGQPAGRRLGPRSAHLDPLFESRCAVGASHRRIAGAMADGPRRQSARPRQQGITHVTLQPEPLELPGALAAGRREGPSARSLNRHEGSRAAGHLGAG
jgi:cobalt-zinc-cadmium efflux system protein